MKTILLIIIGMLFSVSLIMLPVYAVETFDGKASFERVPEIIISDVPNEFEIKLHYVGKPYVLYDLTPIIDINPESAIPFVQIETVTSELYPSVPGRIPVIITIDKDIPHQKIFLSVSYDAKGMGDIPYKSSWSDFLTLEIGDDQDYSTTESLAEEQILMLVDDGIKITYYTGQNIISSFFNSESSSVIFETENNATLDAKVPKLHKHGEELFVLRNGEESIVDKQVDDCFYHVTLETQTPEKIEFVISYWPEQNTKLADKCEKISSAPSKQLKFGINYYDILCKQGLELVIKSSDSSPACVHPETKAKLFERGWTDDANISGESSRHCYLKPETGLCKAAIEKYYFDWETNSCRSFTWGGCGGVVPYDTLESCKNLCN
ncbi:MAG: BPTI/Kunitz domain-containing protein [Nitrosopumilus sp.]|nr:BPTI/Kunitz domain-containing protein [Nitrosopumilus sp.]